MRNLNGYEINGRNLRVDFADGGDKTSNNNHQNHGINDRQSHGGGGGGSGGSSQQGVSGEALINAIENAMKQFGPVRLYDMLVQLKEHARQKPEYTKTMLMANPALTHAIVQCFKTLNIPIPSPSETHQPALLSVCYPVSSIHLSTLLAHSRMLSLGPSRTCFIRCSASEISAPFRGRRHLRRRTPRLSASDPSAIQAWWYAMERSPGSSLGCCCRGGHCHSRRSCCSCDGGTSCPTTGAFAFAINAPAFCLGDAAPASAADATTNPSASPAATFLRTIDAAAAAPKSRSTSSSARSASGQAPQ